MGSHIIGTFKNLLAEVNERFNYDIEELVSVTDNAIKYEFGFLTFRRNRVGNISDISTLNPSKRPALPLITLLQ